MQNAQELRSQQLSGLDGESFLDKVCVFVAFRQLNTDQPHWTIHMSSAAINSYFHEYSDYLKNYLVYKISEKW